MKDSSALDNLLLSADAAGAVVGGICNGALLVAKSGLLRHRQMTHIATAFHAAGPEFKELIDYAQPYVAQSTFLDQDVVIDDQTVTAKPWAAISFASVLGSLCGLLDERGALKWESYQRGTRL